MGLPSVHSPDSHGSGHKGGGLRRGVDGPLRRSDVSRVHDDDVPLDHRLGGTTHRTLPRVLGVAEGVGDPIRCGRVDGVAVLDVEQEALPDEARVAGVSYAATSLPKNSVGTKQLKAGAVKRSDIAKRAVTGSKVAARSLTGKQIKASTLGQVPSAAHAGSADTATNATHAGTADSAAKARVADLLGASSPSDFFPANKVRTFNVKLSFGETQTLFSVGTLTFSARCVENGADPNGVAGQDVVELLVATSQNGAILSDGENGGRFGRNPSDFLDTDTAEADRAVAWVRANTGTSLGGIENNGAGYGMHVVDPNGVVVSVLDPVTGAVNLFGPDCLLAGTALIP